MSEIPYADQIGRWHQFDKGLGQMHRTVDGQPVHSLRGIGKRHTDPNRRFSFLWYNTWLIDPPLSDWDPPELSVRADAIGHRIGQGSWDVVALCEVFDEETRQRVRNAVGQHRAYDAAWGGSDDFALSGSGLLNFAFNGSSLENGDFHSFEAEGSGIDIEGFASKGVLYRELRLQKEGSAEEFVLNLFTTHLHAENADVRKEQIKELVDFVQSVRNPTCPTLIAGDFNVRDMGGERLPYIPPGADPGEWSVTSEFDKLLRSLSDFEDLGLTRGGLAASTHSQSDYYTRTCQFDPSAPWQQRYCDDYPADALTSDHVPGFRIDYVFLEQPKKEHAFLVDTPRIRRRPMFRDTIALHAGYIGQSISPTPVLKLDPQQFWTKISEQQRNAIKQAAGNLPTIMLEVGLQRDYCGFLSDHLAIEVDLIVTPMSEIT